MAEQCRWLWECQQSKKLEGTMSKTNLAFCGETGPRLAWPLASLASEVAFLAAKSPVALLKAALLKHHYLLSLDTATANLVLTSTASLISTTSPTR